jgi:hypothetical protein
MITKIISGGHTGADRGGLDAAIHCGLPYSELLTKEIVRPFKVPSGTVWWDMSYFFLMNSP